MQRVRVYVKFPYLWEICVKAMDATPGNVAEATAAVAVLSRLSVPIRMTVS